MTPVPADMLLFFIIRMDRQMIENMLNENERYAGAALPEFLQFLDDAFSRHRALGDETILALPGKFGDPQRSGYSFMGNKSFEPFELVLVANDQKEVVEILTDKSFVFDPNNFVIKK